jgi:4-amino-4-deoxy-L-arabinose transferase-like glycosyltransferase
MATASAVSSDPSREGALAPSLTAWMPYLWSRVLFPGRAPADASVRASAFLLLLVLPGLLLYPCLSFHLFEPDEGRYAEIAREMTTRGEWIVPYLQGEPYLDKPPLLYWLTMISYRIFGVHDWAARVVPALAVHLTILTVYLLGRRSLGERGAFWGALLLGLAPGFVSTGRLLLLDGLLTLWATLSVLTAYEAVRGERLRWPWWILSALACGLGILTKGPIALVLLVPPLIAHRWLTGQVHRIGRRQLLAYAAIVGGVLLPWHLAIAMRIPEFFTYFFWRHNVLRFLAPFDHLEPIWYYIPIVLTGLLPGMLLSISFVRFLLSGHAETAGRRCPELGFYLLAGGWCLLFFTLSGSKLPTYVLPAFPPLALALGYYLSGSKLIETRWPIAVASSFFVLLLAGHFVVMPWYARYRSPVARFEDMARYCDNPEQPVICFPRNCESVGFYFERNDLREFRSHDIEFLRTTLRQNARTVVLCTHRHSLAALREALPPELQLVDVTHFGLIHATWLPAGLDAKLAHLLGDTALGLCDAAVVERRR